MKIHSMIESSTVNGPRNECRTVIWTAGCSLHCKGCWNPETWDPNGGRDMSAFEVWQWVSRLHGISGLTLSGGEPLQQAQEVGLLIGTVRHGRPDLSIGMFTGYTLDELETPRKHVSAATYSWWPFIRKHLDFAIMGRFNSAKPCADPLTTSTNQRIHLFSDRYTLADFGEQAVEISIADDGLTQLTGFPVRGQIV